MVLIVRQLYSRDTRRQFCPPGHWINDKLVLPQDRSVSVYYQTQASRKSVTFYSTVQILYILGTRI